MPVRKMTLFLAVDLRGNARVLKSRPAPTVGEAVVQVNLKLPTPPAIAAVLDIELPDPPEAVVDTVVAEWTPVEDKQ